MFEHLARGPGYLMQIIWTILEPNPAEPAGASMPRFASWIVCAGCHVLYCVARFFFAFTHQVTGCKRPAKTLFSSAKNMYRGQTMDKPWTNRGTTIKRRGTTIKRRGTTIKRRGTPIFFFKGVDNCQRRHLQLPYGQAPGRANDSQAKQYIRYCR